MYLIVTRSFPPEVGGMQNHLWGFSKELSKNFMIKVFADFTENHKEFDKNDLLIHIRSGDIFDDGHPYYIQNPLNYYLELISRYDKAIVVSSQPFNNPVIAYLIDNPKVEIQSSTIEEDFNILTNAKNLATSGVGTFAIAAAMCSKKIENLYYSDLFFNHHLNPTMLKKVNHIKFKFENYLKIGEIWDGTSQHVSKMLSDKVKILEV